MHQRRPALILLIAASLCAGTAAQTPVPPRDTRPSPAGEMPKGTASVVGSVAVSGSGQPARKARVVLTGGEPRISLTKTTDDRGAFSFTSLPAGRYSLSVSKTGHVAATYGQHRPGSGRPGTPIQLADGQRFDARLQLPKAGALTGTIVDEQAESMQGVQVRAMRYAYQNGVRTLQHAGNGTTDDRGIYRIFSLQPGDYVVCATPRNPTESDAERLHVEVEAVQRAAEAAAASAQRETVERAMLDRVAALRAQMAGQPDAAPTGYAPVCFPGTTTPSAATAVTLGVGEERAGLDFQLQLTPLGRVEGTVISSGNVQNVQITMSPSGESAVSETRSARPDREGRFRFSGLPPGQYTVVARGTLPPPTPAAKVEMERAQRVSMSARDAGEGRLWAISEAMVDGRTPANVVLTMQPGMTISGQLAFEGTTQQPPPDLSRLRVTAMAQTMPGVARELGGAVSGRVDASGRFTIAGVMPGQYRLSAGAPGWFLESATIAGQDALDLPAEIKPGQNVTAATITFSDRQAEFSGTAINERNEPVSAYSILLFPADARYWSAQSRRIQSVRPGTDGKFTFRALPPGEYRLATVFDPEPGAWYDPAFLQQLQGASTQLRLMAGEKKVQDVRVPGR